MFKLREAGACEVNYKLLFVGEVSASKAGNVENLKKAIKSEALKDVFPASISF
jgi:hypothetical protein